MGDVVPFRKKADLERARGKTLCREGFHKWVCGRISNSM